MPRTNQLKAGARKYNSSSQEDLQRAANAFRNGMSQRQACKELNVGRSTLQLYLQRQQQPDLSIRKPGGQTVLSEEAEHSIVQHIRTVSEWGFPFNSFDIRMTVKRIIDKEGRVVSLFKDNLPGEEWLHGFLKRHKADINDRLCQNISKARAKIDADTIGTYFEELKASLEDVPRQNIINYDETNLTDDPGRKKYIFKRGMRYTERIINSSKASTSLMLAEAADGKLLPVYVVYKSEHLWSTWTEGGPKEERFNRSKSGWFDQVCFEDWFSSVALPFCKRLQGKKVLIGDNLSSHFSDKVLGLCAQNNISFICLPPNATHLCQPLDVAFFGPMKKKWRQILTRWKTSRSKTAGTISKDCFPKLLNQLMEDLDPRAVENLQAGFQKCGIWPLSPQPVLQRLPSNRDVINDSVSEAFTEQLRLLWEGDPSQPRRNKRKRLDVVPGRSVAVPVDDTQEAGPSNANINRSTTSESPTPSDEEITVPPARAENVSHTSSDSDAESASDTDTEDFSVENSMPPPTKQIRPRRNVFEQFN